VPRERIALSWRGSTERRARLADITAFRTALSGIAAAPGPGTPWQRVRAGSPAALRLAAQTLLYAGTAMLIGAFSSWPQYRQIAADAAVVKLSFSHAAPPREPCAQLTPAEMARLPINMRLRTDCRRDRWPVTVELMLDGRLMYHGTHRAAGLHDDGPSTIYRRFAVPAGAHVLTIRMDDLGHGARYDYEASRKIDLRPGQSFVVDFDNATSRFSFR